MDIHIQSSALLIEVYFLTNRTKEAEKEISSYISFVADKKSKNFLGGGNADSSKSLENYLSQNKLEYPKLLESIKMAVKN